MAKYLDGYHDYQAQLARKAGVRSESDIAASWIVGISMVLAGLIVVIVKVLG